MVAAHPTIAYRADADVPTGADVGDSFLAEGRGTYRLNGASSAAETEPQVEPFTMVLNRYYDEVMPRLRDPFAWQVLSYILRHTAGYQRTDVRLTITQLCSGICRRDGSPCDEGTGLSRPTVITALHTLQERGLITVTVTGHGRGAISIFRLLPSSEWKIAAPTKPTESRNGKSALPINGNGQDALPIKARNGKSALPKAARNGKALLPLEIKRERKGEKETTARAEHAAEDTPPKARREPKVSPEEQTWCGELLTAIEAATGQKLPNRKADWAAARVLYAWPNGRPSMDDVVDCFTITLKHPRYDTHGLWLQYLVAGPKHFAAYERSGRDAYGKGIERSRKGADGEYEARRFATNGHQPPPEPARPALRVGPDNPFATRKQTAQATRAGPRMAATTDRDH